MVKDGDVRTNKIVGTSFSVGADAYGAALQAAEFDSVRGKFKFNTNHHPIQDFYVREVVKNDEGVLTNKIVATSFTDHSDAYAAECPLK